MVIAPVTTPSLIISRHEYAWIVCCCEAKPYLQYMEGPGWLNELGSWIT
jgi:hypothetical protein